MNDGFLEFEGEFLNDKEWIGTKYDKNGNINYKLNNNITGTGVGIELWGNCIKRYEGKYINGKRNGKGKEYYFNGELKFEGEYLNDLKWNGKGYDPFKNNNILYKTKDGKGSIKYYNDITYRLFYEGEYVFGNRNGKGKDYCDGKLRYEGNFLNDKRNGKGKEYNIKGNLYFEGEYLYDFKIKGKNYINEKVEYEGEFLYNKKWNGKGYDENGNFIYQIINGNGKIKEYDLFGELRFEGEYLNGIRNGKGKEYFKGELQYEGEYLNGKRNGKGKEYLIGELKYEGEYLDGKRNGKGKEYLINRYWFEGEFVNGKKNGKGKKFFDGKLFYNTKYLNGKLIYKRFPSLCINF